METFYYYLEKMILMVHVSDCCRYCDDYLDTDEGAEHHDDDGDDVVDSMVRNLSLLFLF